MLARRALRRQAQLFALNNRRFDHHSHHDDTTEYPKEPGFATRTWGKVALFAAVAVAAYKYAPERGPDAYLTQWLEWYTTPAERWLDINAQHTLLSKESLETNLLLASAQRPIVHRFQFPQAFENKSPYKRAVGIDVDMSDVKIKQ